MRSLALALGFLSLLPVPRVAVDAVCLGRSPLWYPWVGLLLGALATALAALLLPASPLLAAAAYSVALALLSGGLHLDGLGDSADAWVGGHGDRARTLAILKDVHCGPAAVAAVAGLLLMRCGAAHALLITGAWPLLVLAPALGRAAAAGLLVGLPSARPDGLAGQLQQVPARGAIALSLALLAIAAAALGGGGVGAVVVAVVTVVALGRAFRRRIGGVTGDTVGAAIELVELAVLVAVAVWASQ